MTNKKLQNHRPIDVVQVFFCNCGIFAKVKNAEVACEQQQIGILSKLLQGGPKKCTNRTKTYPKLSALGLNFTMNMTREGTTRLSLSKKRPKNQFPDTRGPTTCD